MRRDIFYSDQEDPQKSARQIKWGSFLLFILAISIIIGVLFHVSSGQTGNPKVGFVSS